MQFGAFFLLGSPRQVPSEEMYRRLFTWAEQAERLGYDSIWLAEHHFSNYGYIPNPLMMAVKIGQITQRVRIGTAVLVLPFWHPLRVAEDIAMADQLTGGRMELAVARGYQPYEFGRFGIDFAESRERTDETLEILLRALTEDGFSHEGRFYTIPETTIFPKPAQQPRPPIWLAAHTQESFEIGVRLGLKAFTTNSGRPIEILEADWQAFLAARRKYHDETPIEFAVQQQVCVTPTDEQSRELMDHFRYAFRQVTNLRAGTQQVEKGISTPVPIEGEPSLDEFYGQRTLSGSPARVRERLTRFTEACGLTALNCTFQLGAMEPETVSRSMQLFAEEVMPAFR